MRYPRFLGIPEIKSNQNSAIFHFNDSVPRDFQQSRRPNEMSKDFDLEHVPYIYKDNSSSLKLHTLKVLPHLVIVIMDE